jgi:hypothetical protein
LAKSRIGLSEMVGIGMLIAQIKDASDNILGLRQSPKLLGLKHSNDNLNAPNASLKLLMRLPASHKLLFTLLVAVLSSIAPARPVAPYGPTGSVGSEDQCLQYRL